jgi:DNA-binding transcriptional regulator YiaG
MGAPFDADRGGHLLASSVQAWCGKLGLMQMEAERKPKTSAVPLHTPPINEELEGLRVESDVSIEILAELVGLATRTVQRHLAGDTKPNARLIFRYEKQFSILLKRKVVISKLS